MVAAARGKQAQVSTGRQTGEKISTAVGYLTYLQLGTAGHHLGKGNTDALNDSQQNSTADSTVPRRFVASSNGQRATSKETCNDGIVWILLLANTLDGAVKGREQTTPYAKVATEDRCSHFDGGDSAYSSFAVGGVSVTFNAVPYRTADSLLHERGRGQRVDAPPSAAGAKRGRHTPIQNAPPKSFKMTQGQGSRA